MASRARVNTKFVIGLLALLVVLGGFGAGVWYLRLTKDATRHVSAGDEFMAEAAQLEAAGQRSEAQAEIRKGYQAYGRALHKEPGNVEYLRKMQGALAQIRPAGRDEASELYRAQLGALSHHATHRPADPEAHLEFIHELHAHARFVNQQDAWKPLQDAASAMIDRVAPSDPRRALGNLYRAIAIMRTSVFRTEEERRLAERDLEEFLKTHPGDDRGWAALATGRLSEAQQLLGEGQTIQANRKFDEVEVTVRNALEAVPDGPEVAKAAGLLLGMKMMRDARSVTAEERDQVVTRLIQSLSRSDDPMFVIEACDVIRALKPGIGVTQSRQIIREYLERNPGSLYHRLVGARLAYLMDDLDGAAAEAQQVLDSEPLPVSLLSQVQHELKKQAASLIVDVEYRRFANLPREATDERNARIAQIRASIETLRGLVGAAENDPVMLRARGKLAHAQGDYETAASMLDRLIRTREDLSDFETLILASSALQEVNQIGVAYERLNSAIEVAPRHVPLLVEKARLEYIMRDFDASEATVKRTREVIAETEAAGGGTPQLTEALAALRDIQTSIDLSQGSEAGAIEDPNVKAVADAQEAIRDNDLDGARALLLALLDKDTGNMQALELMARIEFQAQNIEQARVYVTRALEVQPRNPVFLRLASSLDHDDPIEALVNYVNAVVADPAEREVTLGINLGRAAMQNEEDARRREATGDTAGAAKARDLSTRARAASETHLARARELKPNDPLLMEFEFTQALAASDLPAATALAERAVAHDSDGARGLLYRGRLEMAQQQFEKATRSFIDATTIKPYSSFAWRLLAMAYERMGNQPRALSAYDTSFRCNPNDLVTVRQFVELLVKVGEKLRGLEVLRHARLLLPNDPILREAWLQLEADVGDTPMAIALRTQLFNRARSSGVWKPADRQNAAQLAGLLSQTEPDRHLILDSEGRPVYAEGQWSRMTNSERLKVVDETRTRWRQQAREILTGLESTGQDDLELALLRARLMRAQGDAAGGEKALTDFIARHPDAPDRFKYWITLGAYQAITNKVEEAKTSLQKARELQSPDKREGDKATGEFFVARGDYAQAVQYYEKVLEVAPSRDLELQVVECLSKNANYKDAAARLKKVVDATGDDFFSLMLGGQIALGEARQLHDAGDTDSARRRLADERAYMDRAMEAQPQNPLPLIQRAEGLLAEFRMTNNRTMLDQALTTLTRADEVHTNFPQTGLIRVSILEAMNDTDGAIGELRRLLTHTPRHDGARQYLMQLYLRTAPPNFDAAIEVIAEGIRLNPTLAIWHDHLGELYIGKKPPDVEKAISAFARAYEISPTTIGLGKLIEASLLGPKPDCNRLVGMFAGNLDKLEGNPVLRGFYARVLNCATRREPALEQMRLAHAEHRQRIEGKLDPPKSIHGWCAAVRALFEDRDLAGAEAFIRQVTQTPNAYELGWLATSFAATGRDGMSHATELQQAALAICPPDDLGYRADLIYDIALAHFSIQNYPEALDGFKRVIELQPRNYMALNNAAYLLAEHLNGPEEALPLAERAEQQVPGDPSILDTKGWVLFKLRRYEEAEDAMRQSLAKEPTADICLHLAELFLATGRRSEAETYLNRASTMKDISPQTQRQIQRVWDEIRTSR